MTLADLKEYLENLDATHKDGSHPHDEEIYVLRPNRDDFHISNIHLEKSTLSDGSEVFDLIIG